ncbi:antitoxin Xre/MbcA/ParS toxin-binding domain-containing protein [Photobacterium alginatilyticum]|uniref:antitoxin Xre/MbcA/ParS toxin-binding domain-containing protein n=1 Tax=Photobacterium alginatilyticum TaxID=1775171 RepID=UPI0018657427|nr:antitoxin Xre/MbcA/ParS toxin-binding domain-containing protein [Photobacterium alginatilyticum]
MTFDSEEYEGLSEEQIERLKVIISLATELHEDVHLAKLWVQESVYGLGGKRPVDMISNKEDFEMVCDLVGRLKHGIPT